MPITGLAFFILIFVLRLHTPKTPALAGLAAVDWAGSITIAGATVMFLLGLTLGGVSHPWTSPTILCLLIFGGALFVVFFLIEFRFSTYPIMPRAIFANSSNIASYSACFLHGFLLVLATFFLPLYFQSVLSASVILSGVYILPLALSMSFASCLTGWYISQTGAYLLPIRLGFALIVLGLGLLLDLPHDRQWAKLIIFQLLIGFGIGPNFQALLVAIQAHVKPKEYSTATATFGFMRNLATSIGVVVGNVAFQNSMKKQGDTLRAVLSEEQAELFAGNTAEASVFFVRLLDPEQQVVVKEAFYDSLRSVWIVAVVVGAVGLIVTAFVKGMELSRLHEEVRTGLGVEEKQAVKESQSPV